VETRMGRALIGGAIADGQHVVIEIEGDALTVSATTEAVAR